MKINYSKYNYTDSLRRVDNILNSSDDNYKEYSSIPSFDMLTHENGFYVDITVLHVDIRESKKLSKKNTPAKLAKIYKVYISEVIAVLKGNKNINEIDVEGDGICAIFHTPSQDEILDVFKTAGQISSLIDILNINLKKVECSQLRVGISIESGESLYIKTGYEGSDIDEAIWIGKVFEKVSQYSGYGNKELEDKELMVSESIYVLLPQSYKDLLTWNTKRDCYHGNITNSSMNKWIEQNN